MVILHKDEYNPKIDFLICKNLMLYTPRDCDELDFKSCFFGKRKPKYKHEKTVLRIKRFFKRHDILSLSRQDVQTLYQIVTESREKLNVGIFCKIVEFDDTVTLFKLVNNSNVTDKYTLFRILLLKGYCKGNGRLIIPYRRSCKRMYDAISFGDTDLAIFIFNNMKYRTDKYFASHDVKENMKAVEQVEMYKTKFMKTVGAKELYLFGSLAIGGGNKYSDIDLLAVFPSGKELCEERAACQEFWRDKLNIQFDIIAMSEQEFEGLARPAIKRTLKKVGDLYDVA